MKLPSLICLASLSLLGLTGARAESTAPVDLAQRDATFAPAATVAPAKRIPIVDTTVQDKRFDKTIVEKPTAILGERRAAIDVQETRSKDIREKNSHRPETVEQPMSVYNHREAAIGTAADTKHPPTVTKYQDSLKAASVTNMARYPAAGRATTAKINRFIFRKNAPDPTPITGGAPVTPAAGGSPIRD